MNKRTITINGTAHTVLNAWSSGPGEAIHTYRIAGAYVMQIGKVWELQRDGQFPVVVTVS